ncbi:UDP-glucuronosyltransferase-like [Pholidichthys leucotaenia]
MCSGLCFPALGLLAWLCCLSPGPVQAGKVLVVPVDGSHWLSMKILVKELSQRGHEVLVLMPETSLLIQGSDSFKTEIYKVPYTKAAMDARFSNLKDSVFAKPHHLGDMLVDVQHLVNFTSMHVKACENLLNDEPLMSRLRGEGFDLVLTDPFLPCGSILAHLFSIPAVYFLHGLPCQLDIKANQCPSPLSYVPVASSGNTNSMTFLQRVKNVLMFGVESYMCRLMYGHFDDMVSKYIDGMSSYKELLSHGAIWLVKYDFTYKWPTPVMPNMVFIGGINCAAKAALAADLEEFVNGSGDDGFIVFSLGSMVPSMPVEKAKTFLDAFGRIRQRVVWRYTGSLPDHVPKNVRIMKWLPQNDLLAHSKAKVFMTHGGSHGMYEGICNGVPMLMFPLFGDQGDNVHHMVARGVAEQLSMHDVTTEEIVAALNKMTRDRSYKEKMEKLSAIHLDRPIEVLDLAVFWTEFVMRHKGAEHLRVAAHDLNWFQYHSIDVISFLVLIFVTVLWVILKSCQFCICRCCGKRTAKRKAE